MKLALVFPGCHRRAGVERSVWEAARYWSAHHQVTVVCSEIDREGLANVDVRLAKSTDIRSFAREARALYRTDEFDHVISFGAQPVPADIQWVNSVHRAWLQASRSFPEGGGLARFPVLRYARPAHLLRLFVEHSYFSGQDPRCVIAVSEAVIHDLQRLYGVSPSICRVLHNGFDPADFGVATTAAEVAATRNELGLPHDAMVLCMAANELVRKGYETTLEALALVDDPRIHFLLVGKTAPGAYAARVAELGLQGRVHYGGSRGDLRHVFAASDFFVMPTTYEAFSLAVVESLACGLPVITTRVPGAGDLIDDNVNGFLLAEPRDAGALAAIIRTARDAPRESMRSAAAASVNHLTWPAIMQSALEIMSELKG